MRELKILINRNIKVFFKDKGTLFTAMIAPLIILVLYITFLAGVYRSSFKSAVPSEVYSILPKKLIEGFVNGWLMSSLLAVCSITVSFIANLCMVKDRTTGTNTDFKMTPVKKSIKAIAYYISTMIVALAICYILLIIGLVYISMNGWYLSFTDILLIMLDVLLLVLFGTGLSSIICYFLYSQGAISAVTTIVSSIYGFICGAYMPISQFNSTIQTTIKVLPGTYGTSLLHRHFMQGTLEKLKEYFPIENITEIRKNFDIDIILFNHNVSELAMFLILIGVNILLIGIYVIITNFVKEKE